MGGHLPRRGTCPSTAAIEWLYIDCGRCVCYAADVCLRSTLSTSGPLWCMLTKHPKDRSAWIFQILRAVHWRWMGRFQLCVSCLFCHILSNLTHAYISLDLTFWYVSFRRITNCDGGSFVLGMAPPLALQSPGCRVLVGFKSSLPDWQRHQSQRTTPLRTLRLTTIPSHSLSDKACMSMQLTKSLSWMVRLYRCTRRQGDTNMRNSYHCTQSHQFRGVRPPTIWSHTR